MRPNSSGGPLYLSRLGSTADARTVSVGKCNGAPPRNVPLAPEIACTVFGDQQIGGAIECAHARQVVAHDADAGGLACHDRRMELVDRRFFETKRLFA